MNNYMVWIKEGNYPEYDGTATLVGIYSTKKSAEFIKDFIKDKTNGEIIIEETTHPITTDRM